MSSFTQEAVFWGSWWDKEQMDRCRIYIKCCLLLRRPCMEVLDETRNRWEDVVFTLNVVFCSGGRVRRFLIKTRTRWTDVVFGCPLLKGPKHEIFFFFSYYIQHCFICRPSDSTVSTDAGIEPRTVATGSQTYMDRWLRNKAVNREDKRSRRYRDRDFAKIERSRRYRDR